VDLKDVSKNKRRSKKKEFNEFGKVTELVKKYKESGKEADLLEILRNLEGIINTYTLILSPGNTFQQIYITPYMKKFLGMFLSTAERANATIQVYNQAIARVRWIMRHSTYEDVYSHILWILIQTINGMKVIGDCDCIYYIQLIVRFKLHDHVVKSAKDAGVALTDTPIVFDEVEESVEDILDRMSFNQEDIDAEENTMIDNIYNSIDVSILIREDDIFKCFSPYEKYLIYLKDILGLTDRQILSILKHETSEELKERYDDIVFKCELIAKEGE